MDVFEKCAELIKAQKEIYYNAFEDGKASAGGGDGYEEGFEAGKKAEYDAFWDVVQQNGNRTDYNQAFQGNAWGQENFKPKYMIKPVNCQNAFAYWKADIMGYVDFRVVPLDFSSVQNGSYCFVGNSAITAIGIVDLSNATNIKSFFDSCSKLVTVEKIILKADGSQDLSNFFGWCYRLKDVTIEGVIGYNGLSLKDSTEMSKDSITSIINALSTTTTGLSITLSLTAVNNAFEGGSTGTEWTTLAGTKSNWTINLV